MMASAPAPSVASTKETTNYARLCRLLVGVGSQALRDVFDYIYPPAGLHSALAPGTSAHSTLQLLRKKSILNPSQWVNLYPAVPSSVSSTTFDITLLIVLLRNICNLTPPVTGWDKLPSAADKSTKANIARVKFYRNTVYGHATQASVDDVTFNNQWLDIRSALVALGGANYAAAIDQLRNESMDPDIEEYYKELLKQWEKYEAGIKEQLEKMEDTIRNDLEQVRSDLGNMDEKLDTLIAQKEEQDEDRSDLKEMKREIQTVREKLNEVSTKDQVEELKVTLATLMSRLPPVERKPSMEDVFNGIRQRYKLREGWPAPFPWCEEFHSHLDDVCTKLKVVNRKNPDVPATDDAVNLSGIFKQDEECPKPRRVLIQGTPGVGERVFCQKLVYDWATERQGEECIARFDKVLMLRCRDMKSDLWETIDDQLLPREFGTDLRETFVEFVCQNQSHVLLVLDGLDEAPTDKLSSLLDIVQGGVLPECNLLATARHKPGMEEATEHFDTLLEIEGFTEEVAEEIICEFLKEDLAQESLSNLGVNENLKNISKIKTELYVEIIQCVLRRSRRQRGLPETNKDLIQEKSKTLLKHLGQIALNGLRKDTLDFERSELGSHAVAFFRSFQSEGSEQRQHRCYSFLHKSFQRWFAAFNLYCQLIRKEISPESLFTAKYAQLLNEVLPFTCGLLAPRCKETAIALIKRIATQVNTKTTDAQPLPISRRPLVILPNTKTTFAQPSRPLLKSELMRDTKPTEAQTSGASCKSFWMQEPPIKNDQDAIGLVLVALECIKESRVDLAPEFGSSLNLQTLSLQDQRLSVANVIVLANSLKCNTTVTELNLSGNDIGDADAGLADLLKSNNTLTKLNFSHNAIGEAGASQLVAGLKQGNTTLTDLDLANNNIGDGGATCLADALKSNKTLTNLSLSHNNIGDKGATSLANVLKEYNNVLVLDLSSNNVREDGAKRLIDALRYNKILSQLDLRGNNSIGKNAYGKLYLSASNLVPAGRVILPSPDKMVR